MFETLIGADVPLAVRFFIAFVIVLGLIGAAAWAVRRFGASRLGTNAARGRQPRLAVIDAAAVDGRRRLVLIRRDNVEHLLMIGGPSDLVVESNIVRAAGVAAVRSPTSAEAPARAQPENGQWPLQPQSEPGSAARLQRPEAGDETSTWSLPVSPEPAARTPGSIDTLAGLAEELSGRPSSARNAGPVAARPARAPEPRTSIPPPSAAAEAAFAATEKNLVDMAHRLEAALRRPSPIVDTPNTAPEVRPPRMAEPPTSAERPAPPAGSDAAPAAPKPEPAAKPTPGGSPDESLEQELASLLGRQKSKP